MNETPDTPRWTLDLERWKLNVVLFRWLLPVATGILLAVAYPPFSMAQAAWIALIPLLFALENCRPGEAFRRGYIAGLVFYGGTVWWVVYTTEGGAPLIGALAGTVALIACLALYFGATTWLFAMVAKIGGGNQDSPVRNVFVAVVAAAGWVTLEWVRGKFPMGGLPWNFLGVSQYRAAPLIQFATVTGVYGLSALLCFVNFGFYFTIRRYARGIRQHLPLRRLSFEFYAAMILMAGSILHGVREIRGQSGGLKLRVALVQGNIPQKLKFDPAEKPMVLDKYRTLTTTAMIGRPDLIIWPESATPEPVRYDPESFALATNVAAQANVPLLTGTIDVTPYSDPPEAFNAAVLVMPDGSLGPIYHKMHLVPFGEYVPWRKVLPFMKWLTPIPASFERGKEFTIYQIGPRAKFGAVICFEDTIPNHCRQFVKRGANFLVNLTNDGWFKQSPAAELHLANAVFRTVENRRPLIRATNTGVTCIVNEFGMVTAGVPSFCDGSLNAELNVPWEQPTTFYTRHGDVFVGVCALIAVAAVSWVGFKKRP